MKPDIPLEVLFVAHMPPELAERTLYVSHKYGIAIHLCACGCKGRTVTPFRRPDDWNLTENGDGVTLYPSILNKWCGSHYQIRDSKVVWY